MSLGIATRRILAAYQAPRRFPPQQQAAAAAGVAAAARELAFIKIAPLIYSGTHTLTLLSPSLSLHAAILRQPLGLSLSLSPSLRARHRILNAILAAAL